MSASADGTPSFRKTQRAAPFLPVLRLAMPPAASVPDSPAAAGLPDLVAGRIRCVVFENLAPASDTEVAGEQAASVLKSTLPIWGAALVVFGPPDEEPPKN